VKRARFDPRRRRAGAARPRVVIHDAAGRRVVLAPEDATARRLLEAAEALILASQSRTFDRPRP
jgi:hypothetical protein